VFLEVADSSPIWRTDPVTMRDVVLDREAVENKLEECTPLERVWILALLDRNDDALPEGLALLAESQDRLHPLLVLAQGPPAQLPVARSGKDSGRGTATGPDTGARSIGTARHWPSSL
jgi:hypothetical protein